MIWAIGDLHLDSTGSKPMDIFGDNWIDHDKEIIKDWKEKVSEDDLVLLPGDISWALRLDEAKRDLERIDLLPGKKVMIKGNHDYWWGTMKKLRELQLKSIEFIYNSHFEYEDTIIIGTRGWDSRDSLEFDEKDETIFKRELNRLKLSYESISKSNKDKTIIMMIHYPPFNIDGTPNEFLHLAKEFGVNSLVYGHIHGPGLKYVKEGNYLGIDVKCVSSDYLDFKLAPIVLD